MEIMIIGGALVALMVYVSTKIKKSAADAYEAEPIETSYFRLVKPEGLLHPIRDESEFAFEAYTKDFGEGEAEKFRQATATVRISEGGDFASICETAKNSLELIKREDSHRNQNGQEEYQLVGEQLQNDVPLIVIHKIIADGNKVFDLQITYLKEFKVKYYHLMSGLFASFNVK